MTDAHKKGNEKYLQKFKTKSIRVPLDDWERIERYYQGKGCTSFAGWIMSLVYREIGDAISDEIGDAAGDQDTGDHGHQGAGSTGDHRRQSTKKRTVDAK